MQPLEKVALYQLAEERLPGFRARLNFTVEDLNVVNPTAKKLALEAEVLVPKAIIISAIIVILSAFDYIHH